MAVAREVQALAVWMYKRTLFVLRSVDCRSQVYRTAPATITLALTAVQIQAAKAALSIAGEVEHITIRRDSRLTLPTVGTVHIRDWANAVPHAVGERGIVEVTILLPCLFIALTNGKNHHAVIRGDGGSTLVVLSVERRSERLAFFEKKGTCCCTRCSRHAEFLNATHWSCWPIVFIALLAATCKVDLTAVRSEGRKVFVKACIDVARRLRIIGHRIGKEGLFEIDLFQQPFHLRIEGIFTVVSQKPLLKVASGLVVSARGHAE